MERLSGWTLFRFRGVAVKLHISLLFLIFYVVLVASASFPLVVQSSGISPNEITGSPWLWSFIFSDALIVSIFVHELGHVIVAQAQGLKVRAITLMMLGGVSQMEKMPEKPKAEFQVAIIGPLVSLVLAGLLFLVRAETSSANLAFFCYWVGQTNLLLGIFNLIPAFPTDGGRVLRSILSARLGRLRGTQAAVKVSTVFAWIFGLIGLLQFNFLLILIAVFLYAAAKSELFVLVGQILLRGVKAKEVMVAVPVVSEDCTLAEAVRQMTDSRNLLLPVQSSAGPALISAELIETIPREIWGTTLVRNIQLFAAHQIGANDSLQDAWMNAMRSTVSALPVVEDQQIVGLIRRSDIMEMIQLKQLTTKPKTPARMWSFRAHHAPSR